MLQDDPNQNDPNATPNGEPEPDPEASNTEARAEGEEEEVVISVEQAATEFVGSVIENPAILLPYFYEAGIIIIKVLVIFILARILSKFAKNTISRSLARFKIDQTLAKFFGNLASWVIMIIAFIAILESFDVQMTGLIAIMAGASLALGLAFQGSLGNLASGVMLLVFRPFKVGDFVTVNGVSGTVDEIELFSTTLDTPDNRRLLVPNGAIFGSTIENISHHPKRRVEVAVGTAYNADIDQAREVLLQAARSVEGRLQTEEPTVYLNQLGNSSIDWFVRVWAPKADFLAVKERLTRDVKVALDNAGISIPFPQMDVHLDKAD